MDLELTISGLCAVVVEADEDRPRQPRAIDVLCPAAHGHQARLSWYPNEVVPGEALRPLRPDLAVDPTGTPIASLRLDGQALRLEVLPAAESFELSWGDEAAAAPASPEEEGWMNWLPPLADLGLEVPAGFRLGPPGTVPGGASARLTLAPGELRCARIVHERDDRSQPMLWRFPATGKERALANTVVYRARRVDAIGISLGADKLFSAEQSGKLRIAISNDLGTVPFAYNRGSDTLEHLQHFDSLVGRAAGFRPPEAVDNRRTGHPICNGVFVRLQG